jgi:CubicO group peptidase (beta-lactamase class C family)
MSHSSRRSFRASPLPPGALAARRRVVLFTLVGAAAGPLAAQPPGAAGAPGVTPVPAASVVRLTRGQTSPGEIRPGEVRQYAVDLGAGQFVAGDALQQTVDVEVTVTGPDGRPVARALTFARAYGTADLTQGVPITSATVFNIASVSKQFTGASFAVLAEQGRLALDDDVRRYLPALPDFGPAVTLRHLLTHTSGYREAYGVLALQGRSGGDVLRRSDALDAVRRQPALQFAPGSRHLYNSTAYVLLTDAHERVTGTPFPDWMARHVFAPLGMAHTRIEREPGEVIPRAAVSYVAIEGGGYREDFEAYNYYGATDVYTTVGDVARWLGVFRPGSAAERALAGPGVTRRMLKRGRLANGDTLRYTLGLERDTHLGLARVQHDGATGGYRSFVAYYPALDAGVVVLANTGAVDVLAVGEAVAGYFLGGGAPTPAAAATSSAAPPTTPVQAASATRLDASARAYAGAYCVAALGRYTVTPSGTGLALREPDGRTASLVPLDDSTFRVDAARTLRFRPASAARGAERPTTSAPRTDAVLRVRGEGDVAMYRVAAPGAPAAAYAGRYFSDELEAFYTVDARDGALTLTHRRLGTLPLTPEGPDHFSGPWPVREVAFQRDADGRVTGLRVSVGRTLGVAFRRTP